METTTEPIEIPVFPNLQNPLEIKIPVFEGPLDLLLHLIRKKELDIYKVQLSELTSSYLAYMKLMDSVNLDYAGEFIETAATLIWIKSKYLLPKPPIEDEMEEEDPEERLRRQLIEYQKYKQAAFLLGNCDLLGRDVFNRAEEVEGLLEDKGGPQEPVFDEVSLFGLMEAFQKVMARPRPTTHFVEIEQYHIEDRIEEMIQMFTLKSEYQFENLFPKECSNSMLILTFLGVLEMIKFHLIKVDQETPFGTIRCHVCDDFHENIAKWYDQHHPIEELNIA